MKIFKRFILIIILIIVAGISYLVISKEYYPRVPINNLSKNTIIEILNSHENQLVFLSSYEDYEWYGIRGNLEQGRNELIKMLDKRNWEYKEQEGSGYFFYNKDGKKIVSCEMWTGKYILFKVPKDN